MFTMLWRKFRRAQQRTTTPGPRAGRDLSPDLEANLAAFKRELGASPDLIIRRLTLGPKPGTTGALLFIDGLVDQQIVNRDVLSPLLHEVDWGKGQGATDLLDQIAQNVLAVGEMQRETEWRQVVRGLLAGDTIFLVDGQAAALLLSTKGWEKRAIQEPEAEQIIQGPHEGFTENLRTNTALLRRKISTAGLHFEEMKLGRQTQTTIALAYVKGIVNEKLVNEVRSRLKRIKTDFILDANYVHEFITDAPFSLFPTVAFTERPDVVAAKLLEGRVAIFVDGTPLVNTVPVLLVEYFQSPDDYNFPYYYATMIRWFRYLSFFLAVLAPGLFVALGSYHQELIPTPLMITIKTATEGTPFPLVIEVIIMGLVFEILREAGLRLARPFGQTISIVGALVIGEAAVTAGLVGAPTIIVIALTAITTFVVPGLLGPGIFLRLIYTILAGVLGAYGILTGVLFTLLHLASLRSFGVPYLAPLAPVVPADLKDVLVRAPIWALGTRPRLIGWLQPSGYAADQEEKGGDRDGEGTW